MFVTFDYRCDHCGHTEERFVRRSEMDSQRCRQEIDAGLLGINDCGAHMTRLPAGTRTTFRHADGRLKR